MKPPRFLAALPTFLCCLLVATPAAAQSTRLVSQASGGAPSNNTSAHSAISADGRFVSFWSQASTLVNGDTNNRSDVFVHDCFTGITERVSVDSTGAQANANSWLSDISADGRYVAFASDASNLVTGDFNSRRDVFVHDRATGFTTRVSVDSGGNQGFGSSDEPSISADGQCVAFESSSPLVTADTNRTNDIYVHDTGTGTTTLVSVGSAGSISNGFSDDATISSDGTRVAFMSQATNLVANDTNFRNDIFVHDLVSGATTRVSVGQAGTQSNNHSFRPGIDGIGRYIAFASAASNLVGNDTNFQDDVFVYDLFTSTTRRISVSSSGVQANNRSLEPEFATDGSAVVFTSSANNLVGNDNNSGGDVFVHVLATASTVRVSVGSGGFEASGSSLEPSISGNGRVVAYSSTASNLVPPDNNGSNDIFVTDRLDLTFQGPAQFGNSVNFVVSNAVGEGGNIAWVLLSCTGAGAFPLPGIGNVPLTFDACTIAAASTPAGFAALITAPGTATTTPFPWPRIPPGVTFHAAAVTLNVGAGTFVSVTGATAFTTQ